MKRQVLHDALAADSGRALDLGCGTGTLLVMGAGIHPGWRFTGIDPDVPILLMARRKLSRAGSAVGLQAASATALPYRDHCLDVVVSTLVLHHLTLEEKREALREVYRVLRAGGAFALLDFGTPSGPFARVLSFFVEAFGREHVHENFRGMIPGMVSAAGFESVVETARFHTVFGTMRIIRAGKHSTSPSSDRSPPVGRT
jgi:ubiquinone/menaquinone biosynthesis C-methylase UbiE